MSPEKNGSHYVLCLSNKGYEFSLEVRKLYPLLPDPDAESHGMLRVIDETDEDYLFPASLFAEIELPEAVEKRLAAG